MLKLFVVLACVTACKERTELMIGVATDLRAPGALDEAELVIANADNGVPISQTSWLISGNSTPFNLPGSFALVSDGEEPLLEIELKGYKAREQILSRRAVTSLVEGQTLFLRLTLVGGCMDLQDCGPDQSCIEGVCRPRQIDPLTLPQFTDELVTSVSCIDPAGPVYLQTQTGEPMPPSNDAAACPMNLCSEGTCHVDPTTSGGGGRPDGGQDVPVLPPHLYVIDKQTVPQNNTQANQFGLDLDSNGTVDNQLGRVTGILSAQGLNTQSLANSAVDRGESITLVNFGVEVFGDGSPATLATFLGTNPQPAACANVGDTICRKHFAGDAMFDVSPDSPSDSVVVGSVLGGQPAAFESMPGRLTLNMVLTAPAQIDLVGARARVTAFDDNAVTGVIGGGVTQSDLNSKIIPAWTADYNAHVAADCSGSTPPSCNCAASSTGQTLIALFDTNPSDCAISVTEVRNSSIIQSLLAPDLTIDGQPVISVGIGFTAVRANFSPPQ